MQKRIFLAIPVAILAAIIGTSPANAALLLHEPFDYGNDNVSLTAVSGSAIGLDGTGYTGYVSSLYESAGLTFGNLTVSGGNAKATYSSGTQANTRGLDVNVAIGSTLYGSFIYSPDSTADKSTAALLFGSSTATDNTANLAIVGAWYNTTLRYTGINANPVNMQSVGEPLAFNDVVLVLFRVTNMRASSGTQTISLWVLNEDQYAHHKAAGLTPSILDAASTGTGASQVLQTADTTTSTPTVTMIDSMFMRIFIYRCTYRIDEIRLSDTSLNEVTPGPPAGTILSIR